MPAAQLDTLVQHVADDPGLAANIPQADIDGGVAAAELMNRVIMRAIDHLGVNKDGMLTPGELRQVTDYIRARPWLLSEFKRGHGDDEGNEETGFHLVQGDGGALQFQGRNFVDTIADAIYHVGFAYRDGRYRNEDGNENERVDDIAGWLNYFLNGENRVYGTGAGETLHSGDYSFALADAADEIFMAGGGNDAIWAGAGNDRVIAGTGHDRAGGGDGDDKLEGGAGNDSMSGNAGDDTVVGGTGNDKLGGDEGDDVLRGKAGHDHLWGGQGRDTLEGEGGNDHLGGGSGRDRLIGDGGDDKLYGEEHSDTIWGGSGNDSIGGGDHDDRIAGGSGNDRIGGDDGNDRVVAGSGNDQVYGGRDNDHADGGDGRDTMGGGHGNDTLIGGAGNDTVYGDTGNDRLMGYSGHDKISGGGGHDRLMGASGNDTIYGGEGQDTIDGGGGQDRLIAWEDTARRDVFVFSHGDSGTTATTRDTVEGFVSGTDVIDLRSYGGLTFIAGSQFNTNGAGKVRFDGDFIEIDRDGNGKADAVIELLYVAALGADDFLL